MEKVGGPSVKPYQPPGLWQELASGGGYVQDKGDGLYRRSLYTYWKRTVTPPFMANFDSPNREVCTVYENRTNTPLQALDLMNDVRVLRSHRANSLSACCCRAARVRSIAWIMVLNCCWRGRQSHRSVRSYCRR